MSRGFADNLDVYGAPGHERRCFRARGVEEAARILPAIHARPALGVARESRPERAWGAMASEHSDVYTDHVRNEAFRPNEDTAVDERNARS